jgi:hypothetical protein
VGFTIVVLANVVAPLFSPEATNTPNMELLTSLVLIGHPLFYSVLYVGKSNPLAPFE